MRLITKPFVLVPLLGMCFFILKSCSNELRSDQSQQGTKGTLLFNSGFEPGSKIAHGNDPFTSDDKILGRDLSVAPPNDWVEDIDKSSNLGRFSLQYQGADTTYRFARIIQEPGNPGNRVLHFQINQPWVNSKGSNLARIQANIYDEHDGNMEGIKELYQTVRLFLHEDMEVLKSYPNKITWLTILEIWNNHTWNNTPYPYRLTVGIGKPSAESRDLYFKVDGQDYTHRTDSSRARYIDLWHEMNTEISVPVGKWMTLEYYIKEGDGESGRFYMAMTPEGGTKKVVFDIQNFTHNTKDPNPDGITLWNPLKLYTSRELTNFVRCEGKSLQVYWDDLVIWKDKAP
jgi:hypothetical protein